MEEIKNKIEIKTAALLSRLDGEVSKEKIGNEIICFTDEIIGLFAVRKSIFYCECKEPDIVNNIDGQPYCNICGFNIEKSK